MRHLCTAVMTLMTFTAPATAKDWNKPDGLSLGLIATASTSPYKGKDNQTALYPTLNYKQGPVSLGTDGLTYELIQSPFLSVTTGIVPRFTALMSTKTPELSGIKRKVTGDFLLGLDLELGGGLGTSLVLKQEITGEHEGQEFVGAARYGILQENFALEFTAGAAWQSKELSHYTWGVSKSEARANRAAYAPGDVVIPFVGVSTVAPLSDSLTFVTSVRAEFLPKTITNSPIVKKKDIFSASVGLSYDY
jgi:outer membrane scaffolding protein for murein synthesis (MipA/OmpV family)